MVQLYTIIVRWLSIRRRIRNFLTAWPCMGPYYTGIGKFAGQWSQEISAYRNIIYIYILLCRESVINFTEPDNTTLFELQNPLLYPVLNLINQPSFLYPVVILIIPLRLCDQNFVCISQLPICLPATCFFLRGCCLDNIWWRLTSFSECNFPHSS